MAKLEDYLDKPVRELVAPPTVSISQAEQERHRIYALLLMAITRFYWNGMKSKRDGTYPLNPSAASGATAPHLDDDYLGHNIACLATDHDGLVIDFDFNHNEIFNSSAEHAETRLVRRIFSLAQAHDSWNVNGDAHLPQKYGNMLTSVTIYTTLESCSQCSGVMALGQVKSVVFLQQDPGMYHIGNILRRLTVDTPLQAPLPVPGNEIGLPYYEALNSEYKKFAAQQTSKQGEPFFKQKNGHDRYSDSITSFLCTRTAYDIYFKAEQDFDALDVAKLEFPDFRPGEVGLTNAMVLAEAKSFRQYAIRKGQRGTPHH